MEREKMRKAGSNAALLCVAIRERRDYSLSAEGTGVRAACTSQPLGHQQLVLVVKQFWSLPCFFFCLLIITGQKLLNI